MTPIAPTKTTNRHSTPSTAKIGFDPPRAHSRRSSALRRLLRQLLGGAPPKRKRRRHDLRINTMARFARVHSAAAERLDAYTQRRDPRYRRLTGLAHSERGESAAHYMHANNEHSRIFLARVLLDELGCATAPPREPFSFVSIVPVEYVLALNDAEVMSADARLALVRRLQFLARQTLQGMNYIAMVEPALYKRHGPDGLGDNRDGLFWHVHAIVWGPDTQTVRKQARENIGKRHTNIFGKRAVWVKSIEADELKIYALYLVKAPLKHYDLKPTSEDFVDPETGEVFTGTGYRQQTDIMGTGDRVRVATAMGGLLLDKLLFSGGAGRAIVTSVVDRVTKRWRAEERRWRERQAMIGGRNRHR